jgi:phosphoribosylformylglycinamidine synthase
LLFEATLDSLIRLWESTSDQLELLQMNPDVATEQAENHGGLSPTYHVPFLPQCTPVNRQSCEGNPKVAILREEGSNGDREMTSAFFEAGFEVWDVTMTDLLSGKVTLDMFQGLVAVGGFSYKDTLDSAKGWAGVIRFNPELRKMFSEFYERGDTFSLGVCNGCQLFSLLGWVPGFARKEEQQPRFVRNLSERFESRWSTVMIPENNSIMLQGMAGSVLGIWVAHGEGRLFCPDAGVLYDMKAVGQVALQYVDPRGCPTVSYPYNPNGSPDGITGICSVDGRHLAIMPHPERAFLQWQWPWMPQEWQGRFAASPWLRMFQNAYDWCVEQQR